MTELNNNSYKLSPMEINDLINEAQRRYGYMSSVHLARSLDVVYAALSHFPRVCAMRVDVRMAQDFTGDDTDMPSCFQRADPNVITRFFDSLKSQLREDHRRKCARGIPQLPKYIWVRERDKGRYPHYHLILLFNKDVYAYLGDYSDPDATNMATRVQKAWCSALGLHYPDYAYLVHFPKNPVYSFDRRAKLSDISTYKWFLLRLAYLSKVRTKHVGDGQRNFGCSQS